MSVFFLFFLSSFLLQSLLYQEPWLQLARLPSLPARSPPPLAYPAAGCSPRPPADCPRRRSPARRTPADPRSRTPARPGRSCSLLHLATGWQILLAALARWWLLCSLLAPCASSNCWPIVPSRWQN
jgi:hypothetical protein